MINKDINCNVIMDLLPLYVDGLISNDSKILIDEHIKNCSKCKEELDYYKKDMQMPIDTNTIALEKISRTLKFTKINIALVTSLVTAAIMFMYTAITFSNKGPVTHSSYIVNPLDDIMGYYDLFFSSYYFSLIIVILNVSKSLFMIKNDSINTNTFKKVSLIDLITTIMSGLIMASGLFFLGILADNNAPHSNTWANRLFIISLIGLVLFIIQVILHSRNKNSNID